MTAAVDQTQRRKVARYIGDVISGRLIVGKLVKKAVKRHQRDLQAAEARGLVFNEKKALRAIRFFSLLRHSKGEWGGHGGQRFELSPFQAFIIWCLFGWRKRDGRRRFKTAYIEIARKNGKSTFAAGVGLYMLAADAEPGAEVYTAATKRDQAKLVFDDAACMVGKSPELSRVVTRLKNNLHVLPTRSKMEPLSSQDNTMDGLNVHCGIVDEYHQHKTRGVLAALNTATGARRQPLIFIITTAGYNKNSPCYKEREYSINVLKDVFDDDTRFVFIATLDDKDDWWEEKNWAKGNPNIGISIKLDELRAEAKVAREMVSAQNEFLTKRLNVWTEQADRWLSLDDWNAKDNCRPFVADEFKGRVCWGGLDLASKIDIAAFLLLFDEPDGSISLLPHFWIPKENAARREKKDRVPYLSWIRDGLITATEGNTIDYETIFADIGKLGTECKINSIGFDRWGMEWLGPKLLEHGLNVFEFGQGFASMSEPAKEFERLIMSRKLRHGGNPVLKWMAGNVATETDAAGNIKPSKKKSIEKIDGIVAGIMSLGTKMRAPVKKESVYKKRGIVTA